MRAAIVLLAAGALLSGCGNRAALEPKKGQSLPVAPYGREEPKTAEALMTSPVQAVPERSIESATPMA